MSEPFMSEIKIVSFNFPPKGWAMCNGQLMPINQNQALFALLGTTYGGNGQTNFALPNLKGRVPIHMGTNTLGTAAGATAVTLQEAQMPTHIHPLQCSTNDQNVTLDPSNAFLAPVNNTYTPPTSGSFTSMVPSAVTTVGGNQPHTNMMPSYVLNFVIALQGIFPSQN